MDDAGARSVSGRRGGAGGELQGDRWAGRDLGHQKGGHHNDRLMVDDGKKDTVYCGSGTDYVYADVRDTVYYGCETVKR